MFSNTGSTMKQATSSFASARSSASGSLYGITMTSAMVPLVMPADCGTELGVSAGPALSSGGLLEIITSSWWPWNPPSTLTILSRLVAARARRMASIVASVPELVGRHIGKP